MDYQLSTRRQNRQGSSVNLAKELDLLKWKKKSEAKQQLRRTKAAHKASSSGIPTIDSMSRTIAVGQKDRQERIKSKIRRISDTLRSPTEKSQGNNLNFNINLSNCTVSRKSNLSLDEASSIIKPVCAETPSGISYESILMSFGNRSTKNNTIIEPEYQPLVPSSKCIVYSSGFNSEAFAKRAKPLITYETLSIK